MTQGLAEDTLAPFVLSLSQEASTSHSATQFHVRSQRGVCVMAEDNIYLACLTAFLVWAL